MMMQSNNYQYRPNPNRFEPASFHDFGRQEWVRSWPGPNKATGRSWPGLARIDQKAKASSWRERERVCFTDSKQLSVVQDVLESACWRRQESASRGPFRTHQG